MALMGLYALENYKTDFGTTVPVLPFKMLLGYNAFLDGYYKEKPEILCAVTSLFSPRVLVATFKNGTKVRYPIANTTSIVPKARELKNSEEPGVVCIDYEGESWRYVPPNLIGDADYRKTPLGGFTASGKKVSGVFSYNSDVLGTITANIAFEKDPEVLLESAKQCWDDFSERGFCGGSSSLNLFARRFRGIGLVLGSRTGGNKRITYSRDIKISNLSDISECGGLNAQNYYCFSYLGERLKNIHNLIKDE